VAIKDYVQTIVITSGLFTNTKITPHNLMVFLGKNDAGKTTALRSLAAILQNDPGHGYWIPARGKARLAAGRCPDERHDHRKPSVKVEPIEGGVDIYCGENKIPAALPQPVEDVVWLDLGDRHALGDVITTYLEHVESHMKNVDLPAMPEDGDWKTEALDALSQIAFEELRNLPTLSKGYQCATAEQTDDGVKVRLKDHSAPYRSHEVSELASGVRAWLHLAYAEAARRLRYPEIEPTSGSGLRFSEPAIPDGMRRLYVIDEPEQHLHPTAHREFADWLLKLSARPGVTVAVATYSHAFLELTSGEDASELYLCKRSQDEEGIPLPSAGIDRINRHKKDRADELSQHSGLPAYDLFLTGRVPLLVEGKSDKAYVEAAWRQINGQEPESVGLLVLSADGDSKMVPMLKELICPVFKDVSPVFVLTDKGSPKIEEIRSLPGVRLTEHRHGDIAGCLEFKTAQSTGLLDPNQATNETWEQGRGSEGKAWLRPLLPKTDPHWEKKWTALVTSLVEAAAKNITKEQICPEIDSMLRQIGKELGLPDDQLGRAQ